MLLKNHTNFICFYVQLWVWTMSHVETKSVNSCTFRFSGHGNKRYEGFLEVENTTDEWNNVCGTIDGNKMCSKLDHSPGNVALHYPIDFNESLQEYAIRLDDAYAKGLDDDCVFQKKEKPCQIRSDTKCCKPIWICCPNIALGQQCSGKWSDIFNNSCYTKQEGKRTSYAEARDKPLDEETTKDKPLAWTKSSLVDEKYCTANKSLSRDVVRKCANQCLNLDNFTRIYVFSDGDCRCNGHHLQLNKSECYKVLKVVNNKKEPAEMCIAAEVKNGRKKFTAEYCDRLLQPFCAIFKDDSKAGDGSTLQPHEGESEDVLVPSIIIFVTIATVAVLAAVICRCCRKKTRKDNLRHCAVYNRTYDRQMPKNDEEYAIISEIELDSGVSVYKPPLPERSTSSPDGNIYNMINDRKDKQAAAIVTLDDYSTPSDVIKDTTDFDLAAEYSTTYDDPIRHNAEMSEETKYKWDNDKQVSGTNHDERCHQCSTLRQENINSNSYECLTGTEVETGSSKNSTESGEINDGDKLGSNRISDTSNSKRSTSALIQRSMTKTGDNFESFTPSSVSVTRIPELPSDYEDTNVIDGNFPTKSTKGIREEHICLHCLKPEHLKKLGIKLIPDKNLDYSEKRFSEPLRKVYGDVIENSRKLRRCKTDVTETDAQYNLITLKGTVGKCVECQNVYDHLGNFIETDNVNSKRDEYHHIGTVKKENC